MTVNKDFKRLVRQRMQRTGESYTSARTKLLHTNYAKLAGMSDASIKAKTGCTWERWLTRAPSPFSIPSCATGSPSIA